MPVLNPKRGVSNKSGGYNSAFAQVLGSGGDRSQDSVSQGFYNAYRQIDDEDRRISSSLSQDDKEEREREREAKEPRQMNAFDRAAYYAGKIADDAQEVTGFTGDFNDLLENPVGTLGGLFANTAVSALTAPLTAARSFYEAGSGHNIQDADIEAGTLGRDLNSNQKAAAGLSGIIDLAGAVTGGTREAGEAIWNTVRGNTGKMAQRAGQFGAKDWLQDVAAEGIEEGAQSLVEDVRNDQDLDFNKAIQSAGWGALGGGMMSLGAYGVNRIVGGKPAKTNTDPSATNATAGQPQGRDYFSFNEDNHDATVGKADAMMGEFYESDLKADNTAAGSASYTGLPGNYGIKPSETVVGVRSLRQMYNRDDASAEAFVRSTAGSANPIDRATADNWFQNLDDVHLVQAINRAIDTGTTFEVANKRDPKTKDSSLIKFTIKNVNEGDGIKMNPAVYQMFGADLDGDTWRIHFDDPQVETANWATQYFMSPRALPDSQGNRGRYGAANFDMDYSGMKILRSDDNDGFIANDHAKDAFTKVFDNHGYRLRSQVTGQLQNPQMTRSLPAWLLMFDDAAANARATGDANNESVLLLNNIRNEMTNLVGADAADSFMSDLIQQLQYDTHLDVEIDRIVRTHHEYVRKSIGDLARTAMRMESSKGSVGEGTNYMDMLQFLGKVLEPHATNENPALRMDQRIQWTTASIASTLVDSDYQLPAIDDLVAWQMHIIEAGQNPYDAVSSMFKAYVYRDMLNISLANPNAPYISDDGTGYQDFRQRFEEIYNRNVESFNNAMRTEGYDDNFVPIGAPRKSPIEHGMPQSWSRSFMDVCGDRPASDIVSFTEGQDYVSRLSLNDLVYKLANGDIEINGIFTVDEQGAELLRDLARDYNSLTAARGQGLKNSIEAAVSSRVENGVTVSWDADGNPVFDIMNYPALEAYANTVRYAIGQRASSYFGFANTESMMRSTWGRYLFSENPQTVSRAIGAIGVAYKYKDYIEATVRADNIERRIDEKSTTADKAKAASDVLALRQQALVAATQNYNISMLDRLIIDQIDTGDPNVVNDWILRDIINPDGSSMADIQQQFDDYWDAEITAVTQHENLFSAMMMNNESEIGEGELSSRTRDVRRSMKGVKTRSSQHSRAMWENIKRMANSSGNRRTTVARALTTIIKENMQRQNLDIKAASICDVLYVMHDTAAKGTSPYSAGSDWLQQAKAINSVDDFLQRLTGSSLGSYTEQQARTSSSVVTSVMADDSVTLHIDADDGTGSFDLSREAIFGSVGRIVKPGDDPTYTDYEALFDKYPNLLTFFSPTTYQAVPGSQAAVTEVMYEGIDETVNKYMSAADGANQLKYDMQIERIVNHLSNRPRFTAAVIGDVCNRARNEYGSFDVLLSRPRALAREIKDSYRRWARTMYRLANSGGEDSINLLKRKIRLDSSRIMRSRLREDFDIMRDMSNDLVSSYRAASNQAVREFARAVGNSAFLEALQSELNDKNVRPDQPRNIGNVPTSVDFVNRYNQVISVMQMMYDENSVRFADISSISQAELDQMRSDYIQRNSNDPDAGTRFDNAVDAAQNKTILGTSEPISGISDTIITRDDIVDSSADRMYQKIRNIGLSGETMLLSEGDIIKQSDLQTLFDKREQGDQDAKRRILTIRARYNSLTLDKVINDYRDSLSLSNATLGYYAEYEALNTVEDMIDEVRNMDDLIQDSSIHLEGDTVPAMDFTDPTIVAFANHVQTVSESSGNSSRSGIEGGGYQRLLSFGAINASTFGLDSARKADAETMSLSELRSRINLGTYRFINPYMHCRAVVRDVNGNIQTRIDNVTENALNSINVNDETVVGSDGLPILEVYPLDQSAHGLGMNTQTGVTGNDEDYVALKQMIMDFVYELSEGHVFKAKKALNMFDSVIRQVSDALSIANRNFSIPNTRMTGDAQRAMIAANVSDFRNAVAEHYFQEFNAEQLSGKFGKYDALLLAQFTNPFIEVSFSDGTYMNMPMDAVYSADQYAAFVANMEADGQSWDTVTSLKPRILSITSMTNKIDQEIATRVAEMRQRTKKDPTRNDYSTWAEEIISDWSGYRRKENGVADLLSSIIPLSDATVNHMQIAGAPSATMNLMRQSGEAPNMSGLTAPVQYDSNSFFTREQVAQINQMFGYYRGSTPKSIPNLRITWGNIDPRYIGRIQDGNDRWARVLNGFNALGNQNIDQVLAGDFTPAEVLVTGNPNKIRTEFNRMKSVNAVLVVDKNAYDSIVENALAGIDYRGEKIDIDGHTFYAIISNDRAMKLLNSYQGPRTYRRIGNPDEISISTGSEAMPISADAFSVVHPDHADVQIPVDAAFAVKRSEMFPGARGALYPVTKDDVAEFKRQFELWVAGDDTSTFSMPKYATGRELSETQVEVAVRKYLNNVSAAGDNAMITENLAAGDCFWFAKMDTLNGTYYSPVIINNGNVAVDMSTIHPSYVGNGDAGTMTFSFSGTLSPRQHDGLKNVFDTVAWKAYEIIADKEMLNDWAHPAVPGLSEDSDRMFNLRTLKSRTVDMRGQIMRDTLWWYSRKLPMSMFFRYNSTTKSHDINEDLFVVNRSTLNDILSPNITETDVRVADGALKLTTDARLNEILQHVFAYSIRQHVPPVLAVGSIAINPHNGNPEHFPLFCEPSAVWGDLSSNEIAHLFSYIDESAIMSPYRTDQHPDGDPYFMFNSNDGYFEMLHRDPSNTDETAYLPVLINPVKYKMDSTLLGMPSSTGAFSEQQLINRAVLNGFQESDIAHVSDMYAVKAADYSKWQMFGDRVRRTSDKRPPIGYRLRDTTYIDKTSRRYSPTMRHNIEMRKEGENNFWHMLTVVDNRDANEPISYNDNRVRTKLDQLNKALGYDKSSDRMLMALVKMATGSTYNSGDGSHSIPLFRFESAVDSLIRGINGNAYPIKGGVSVDDGRFTIPMGPKVLQDWLFNSPSVQKNFSDDRNRWDKLANEALQDTLKSLVTMQPKSKKIVAYRILEYVSKDNNIPWTNDYLMGEYSAYDIAHIDNMFMDRYMSETVGPDMAARWHDRSEGPGGTVKMLEDFANSKQSLIYDRLETQSNPSGAVAIWTGSKNQGFEKVGSAMTNLSRMMSVLNPMLPPSAYIQRRLGSGITKFSVFLDSKGIPTQGGRIRNSILFERDGAPQHTLHEVATNDANLKRIWSQLNELQLTGNDLAAIRNADTAEDVKNILDNVRRQDGRLGMVSGKIFHLSTLSGTGVSWQIENFFNYAASRLDPEQSPWYFERGEDGKTNFELMLENNPTQLLLDLTVGRKGQNPDLLTGLRARNFALESDLSQQTAASMIVTEALSRHSLTNFLLTTNVLKFPSYVFNVSGWYLKWVAPVSSLNYWATDMLVKSGNNNGFLAQAIEGITGVDVRAMHLERTQTFESLHEAAVNDMIRLGSVAIGGLIASMAFEPPEDEDKMGNLNEWTFFGMRLDQAWWLQDILGPAFAIAATFKSGMNGKLRLDILPNWLGQAMYQNPLLRIGDVVSSIFDEEVSPLYGMTSEDDLYKGGDPTATEVWQSGVATYGLNWASQFLLPSFVRELYTTVGDNMEHSYKRVYKTDEAGNIIYNEDGTPSTVRTSYLDSQLRRVARNNPLAALVLNAFGDSKTSYWRSDMPLTVYYENAQLESMDYYSLYTVDPETGEEVPKPVEERRAIAYEILGTLETMTPEELAATGFMIDYETRAYVSKTLFDIRAYLQEVYNDWVQETGMDAKVVGEGNFQLGMQRISAIKEAYYSDYNHINELYNKLWDDSIASGPQKYNRYQTTYQQDQWGNWYATGFRRSFMDISPFETAPGTLSDAGSTMGWENDWTTESVVIPGQSTGQRALIPIDSVYTDKPDIESWSDDGNGNGYSNIWQDSLGELAGTNPFSGDNDDDSNYYPYGRSYGGRRYSRRSGGGGGGGGYSPNIYSRLPNVYLPSARTMYAERIYSPNYDYLRPNFETKGSREAYKRSDI